MGFLLCSLGQHMREICVDLWQGGSHVLHIVDFAHVGAELLKTLQAALQHAVELADHVSHCGQVLISVGSLLELEHHLEREVEVRQQGHQQKLIFD